MPQKISMIMLGISRLDASLPFYSDVLGFDLKQRLGGLAFFDAGNILLALSEALGATSDQKAGTVEVILETHSVNEAQSRLTSGEQTFFKAAHEVSPGMWAATLKDPDGHLITFFGKY